MVLFFLFFFKQKTAYEMRISDWSSDVCSSDLMPSVRRYRLSALPRYVDPATIERIIAACPTGRPVEVRDKAIILLLARLGLRAGDKIGRASCRERVCQYV